MNMYMVIYKCEYENLIFIYTYTYKTNESYIKFKVFLIFRYDNWGVYYL